MMMYAGYLAASWPVLTAGFERTTGTATVRLGAAPVSVRSIRPPSLALSTFSPSRAGTLVSPVALGCTVASRGGRSTAERTRAVSALIAACE